MAKKRKLSEEERRSCLVQYQKLAKHLSCHGGLMGIDPDVFLQLTDDYARLATDPSLLAFERLQQQLLDRSDRVRELESDLRVEKDRCGVLGGRLQQLEEKLRRAKADSESERQRANSARRDQSRAECDYEYAKERVAQLESYLRCEKENNRVFQESLQEEQAKRSATEKWDRETRERFDRLEGMIAGLALGSPGTCGVCGKQAPLVNDECPDCRH